MKSFLSILVLLLVLVLEGHAQTWAEGDIQVSRKLSTAGFAPAELTFGSGLNVAYDNTSKTITVTTSGGAGLGTVTSFAFTNSNGITGTVTNATTTPTLALSLTSAAVGLGNVENTALSTWAGSTALTTLGTITTGTWQGTAISDTYISSAATWNAKQPAGNYLTALTGDVTATGPGSAAATIANAAVTAAKLASNAARDNLTGGSGTLNLSAFTLTLPSDVTRLGSSIDLGSEVTGTLPWASVSKTGSSLADLATRSATDLTSGTLPNARFPATLPAASGTNLTSLDPYNLQQRSATNGQALVWNTTNNRWQPGTVSGGSATPGGNDTELQYNNAGAFGGVDILWVSQSLMMPTNSTGTRAQLGMYSGSITSDIPAKAGDLLTYGGDEAATAQDSDADGGAGGDIRTYGGNGFATGSSGGDRPGGSGGTIDTSGGNASAGVAGRAGGSITTSNGGGSIDTSNNGGSISTRGTGSIGLGASGTRTTLTGTASADRAIALPDASGTVALTSDITAIANGGTGQTSQTAAFDALAPTTTKGDLIVSNGSDNVRVPVGATNGHVLTVDSAEATGVKWAAGGGGGLTNITETLHTASPNNTVNAEQLEVTGGTTNVDLVLTPKGTGALIGGAAPDSATPGGNKRGTNAVDLQLFPKSVNTRVASGAYSLLIGGSSGTASGVNASVVGGNAGVASGSQAAVIGGTLGTASATDSIVLGGVNNTVSSANAAVLSGSGNTASGFQSVVVGGVSNAASGNSALAHGRNATAALYSDYAHASGQFAASGDAQYRRLIARNKTTNNTATELYLDGSTTRLTITSGKVLSATVNIVGVKSDGTAVARYLRQVTIKNVAGTTSLVGSVITLGTDEAASTSVSITADDTNDALKIEVTGITSETWRWVATIEGAEVAYGN